MLTTSTDNDGCKQPYVAKADTVENNNPNYKQVPACGNDMNTNESFSAERAREYNNICK